MRITINSPFSNSSAHASLRFHTPSCFNEFTERIFQVCPGCCGIEFKDMETSEINQLCEHCVHEYKNFLIIKYQNQDSIMKNHCPGCSGVPFDEMIRPDIIKLCSCCRRDFNYYKSKVHHY